MCHNVLECIYVTELCDIFAKYGFLATRTSIYDRGNTRSAEKIALMTDQISEFKHTHMPIYILSFHIMLHGFAGLGYCTWFI